MPAPGTGPRPPGGAAGRFLAWWVRLGLNMRPTMHTMNPSSEPTRIRVGTLLVSTDRIRSSVELILQDGLVAGIEEASGLSPTERGLIAAPGLINAHAHLDLGSLRGAVPAGGSFLQWVGRVVAERAAMGEERVAQGVRDSAEALLRSGTTSVLDIDGTGQTLHSLGDHRLRVAALREVLDGSPAEPNERTEAAMRALAEVGLAGRGSPGEPQPEGKGARWIGISPHATHTVSDALLRAAGEVRRGSATPNGLSSGMPSGMPCAVHFAETAEESEWLMRGTGPFAAWLGQSSRVPGTVRLERAGLLQGALLIHGNDPQPGEPARIAEAGAAVVHCPGSHLFFDRPRFPMETYRGAGVEVLLGTDSWASNDALDMRREMRIARESLGVSASEAWRMATEAPARWIPSPTITGRLHPGDAADIAIFRSPWSGGGAPDLASSGGREQVLEALTLEQPELDRVIVAGQPAF